MPSEIPAGARVELLPDRENVYRFARAGARGIVLDQREDEYGYAMVYVEWDQGVQEPNCWTFASHFKLLDAPQSSAEDMIRKAEDSRPHCPTCGQVNEPETDKYANHLDILAAATEVASEAEGYMVITMETKIAPNGDKFVTPRVYLSTMTPFASTLVESQVVRMAHMYHHERIEAAMGEVLEDENGRQ